MRSASRSLLIIFWRFLAYDDRDLCLFEVKVFCTPVVSSLGKIYANIGFSTFLFSRVRRVRDRGRETV